MSGIADKYGDRLNVVWLAETSEQGRAAKTLLDLPIRGVALLDSQNRLVWRAASSTPQMLEAQVRWALGNSAAAR
ncbi:MAG: hypothetical protein U0822_00265 [Anaerolineae bacterium]